jgi:TIR domain
MTIFGDIDLSTVKGLDTMQHEGPSTIGIDTIYRSKGNIPEAFLRGAGVPETFITNIRALVESMSPINFYSCFISYSSKDQGFAERLYADLQSKDVRCWFAPHHMKTGTRSETGLMSPFGSMTNFF